MVWEAAASADALPPGGDRRPFAHAAFGDPSTWGVSPRTYWWFAALLAIHCATALALHLTRAVWLGPPPDGATPKRRSSIVAAALEVPSLCSALYFGITGIRVQLQMWAHPMEDPLHGENAGSRELGEVMLAVQAYQTCAAIVVPQLRKPVMLVHHFVAALLAHQELMPYLHGYAPFYFGIVEISNWPLCIVDFLRQFPELRQRHAGFYQAARITFAALFIPLRLIVWTILAAYFWYDSVALLMSGRQRSTFAVMCFLVCNIVMTGLQWGWGRLVLQGIYNLLFPDERTKGGAGKPTEKGSAPDSAS